MTTIHASVLRLIEQGVERLHSRREGLFRDEALRKALQRVFAKTLGKFRDRVFTPDITLFAFLFQCLDQKQSCRDVVFDVIVDRLSQGRKVCSSKTSSYVRARQRLPEATLSELTKEISEELEENASVEWKWHGRSVFLLDGSSFSIPDSRENESHFPLHGNQHAGAGLPTVRCVGLISLATGAIRNFEMAPWKGSGSGEMSLARSILPSMHRNEIIVADRLFCSYWLMALSQTQGIDVIARLYRGRNLDLRSAKKISKREYLVTWKRPDRPEWMDRPTFLNIPKQLTLRVILGRTKTSSHHKKLVVITTLLEKTKYHKKEIQELYRQRWHIELDLRAIKETLSMGRLRCQTPSMIHKEAWAHLLAYNIVRKIIAASAEFAKLRPRQISFTAACRAIFAFGRLSSPTVDDEKYRQQFLLLIASNRVGSRPGRSEPRLVKYRPKRFCSFTSPRSVAKKVLRMRT